MFHSRFSPGDRVCWIDRQLRHQEGEFMRLNNGDPGYAWVEQPFDGSPWRTLVETARLLLLESGHDR